MESVTTCRFYKNKMPKMDDIVMSKVTSIIADGYYVQLMEYNNIEGFVTISEASRVRFSSLKKIVDIGTIQPLLVLMSDDSKYIDLSRRRLYDEEIKLFEQKYHCVRGLNNIFCEVFNKYNNNLKTKLEEMFSKNAWKCIDETDSFRNFYEQQLGSDIESFMNSNLWSVIEKFDSFEEFYTKLLEDPSVINNPSIEQEILSRRKQTPAKLEALLELSCYMEDGVESIKKALLSYKTVLDTDCTVSVQMVSPPIYRVSVSSLDKPIAEQQMKKIIEKIQQVITDEKGNFVIKKATYTVNEKTTTLM
jgi:translation initiation factor 2 subunit 1